jgi:hypothetical protein
MKDTSRGYTVPQEDNLQRPDACRCRRLGQVPRNVLLVYDSLSGFCPPNHVDESRESHFPQIAPNTKKNDNLEQGK